MNSINRKLGRAATLGAISMFLVLSVFIFNDIQAQSQPESGFSCTSVYEIPQSECQALVDFYDATNGNNWQYNDGWKHTNTPCSWYGVSCLSGHVSELHLELNGLQGPLPDFAQLPFLQQLILSGNELTGNIPDFPLPALRKLELQDNPLSGQIPDFRYLGKLKLLHIGEDHLVGEIPNFSHLPELEELWVDMNQLSGSIPDFSNLPKLRVFEAVYNEFDGYVPDFSNLGNLTYLGLEHNRLSGSIPDFHNIPNLQTLNLAHNQLTGPVPDFSNLPNLRELYLHHNHLTGAIPDFSHLPNLSSLNLSANRFEGNIPAFDHLTNLNELYLEKNRLDGIIPANFCSRFFEFSDYGYNMLDVVHTDDCVSASESDWRQTQTVPPTDVNASALSSNQIRVIWAPILYTADGGYYEVLSSNTSGGPYTSHAMTSSKLDDEILLSGFVSGQTYYFVVRTFTPAHDDQQNDLTSENSVQVLVMLTDISTDGTDVNLTWTPAAEFAQYEVLYSTDFYFQPEDAGVSVETTTTDSWTHSGAAADVVNNYAYLLRGIDDNGGKSSVFNRIGEFTFALTPGN